MTVVRSERLFSFFMLLSLTVVCGLLWTRNLELRVETSLTPPVLFDTGGYGGPEVLVVLIGSSTCTAATAEWMPDTMARMREAVSRQAAAAGHRVVFLGVALDDDLNAGIEFLRRLGPFHEVSIGRSWMNSASLEYLIREQVAEAAVPQIVMFRRAVVYDGNYLAVSQDELLDRRIGLDEIRAFEAQGFAIRRELDAAP